MFSFLFLLSIGVVLLALHVIGGYLLVFFFSS